MTFPVFDNLLLWRRLLQASVLAIVVGAPSLLRASCGDYVVIGNRGGHSAAHAMGGTRFDASLLDNSTFDEFSSHAAVEMDADSALSFPTPPCSGPGCDGRESSSAPLAVVADRVVIDSVFHASSLCGLDAPTKSSWGSERLSAFVLSGHPASLLRPPQ